jgi:hypothetical protein
LQILAVNPRAPHQSRYFEVPACGFATGSGDRSLAAIQVLVMRPIRFEEEPATIAPLRDKSKTRFKQFARTAPNLRGNRAIGLAGSDRLRKFVLPRAFTAASRLASRRFATSMQLPRHTHTDRSAASAIEVKM